MCLASLGQEAVPDPCLLREAALLQALQDPCTPSRRPYSPPRPAPQRAPPPRPVPIPQCRPWPCTAVKTDVATECEVLSLHVYPHPLCVYGPHVCTSPLCVPRPPAPLCTLPWRPFPMQVLRRLHQPALRPGHQLHPSLQVSPPAHAAPCPCYPTYINPYMPAPCIAPPSHGSAPQYATAVSRTGFARNSNGALLHDDSVLVDDDVWCFMTISGAS